jgi:hypothetical protein
MIKYVIPAIPPSMNKYKGRSNIWEYRKDKELWESNVAIFCTPRPKNPILKSILTLTYFFKDKRRHDPNNYDGQFITDGLVKAGIITDDNFDCIDLVLKGEYDKQNPRTEILIEIKEI